MFWSAPSAWNRITLTLWSVLEAGPIIWCMIAKQGWRPKSAKKTGRCSRYLDYLKGTLPCREGREMFMALACLTFEKVDSAGLEPGLRETWEFWQSWGTTGVSD
jgi:hypothetical protein